MQMKIPNKASKILERLEIHARSFEGKGTTPGYTTEELLVEALSDMEVKLVGIQAQCDQHDKETSNMVFNL